MKTYDELDVGISSGEVKTFQSLTPSRNAAALLDDVTEGSSCCSLVVAIPSSKGLGVAGVNPACHSADAHNCCRPRSWTRGHDFGVLTDKARLCPPPPQLLSTTQITALTWDGWGNPWATHVCSSIDAAVYLAFL